MNNEQIYIEVEQCVLALSEDTQKFLLSRMGFTPPPRQLQKKDLYPLIQYGLRKRLVYFSATQ